MLQDHPIKFANQPSWCEFVASYRCEFNMNLGSIFVLVFVIGNINASSYCGCKAMRPCYRKMLKTLLDRDEAACIEDAAIGTSTLTIFLKALVTFCSEVITVKSEAKTYEERILYEVTLHYNDNKNTSTRVADKPVIILEAGQLAGTESVGLVLYVVEQLVGCKEYHALVENVRWIILPCTNPDGQILDKHSENLWTKNMKEPEDVLSFGVDISRNFDSQWESCPPKVSRYSLAYPGPYAGSENETIFIQDILKKYKRDTKIYVSIRRNGHAILYPYAHSDTNASSLNKLVRISGEIATRVNQRAGSFLLFANNSIYNHEGKPHCGHSVDYAFDLGIPLSFEMRVFLEAEKHILSKFQSLPRGYEASLRNGYFSGIRELYNIVTNEKKYGKVI